MEQIEKLIGRYPVLGAIRQELEAGYGLLENCYSSGGKLLVAGNGGSCADAEHIAGELMKGFCKKRAVSPNFAEKLRSVEPDLGTALAQCLEGALPTVALTSQGALASAFMNDTDPYGVYAQQVFGLGTAKDVFLGISTSGNSRNILMAAVTAKAKGMKVLALTGAGGGKLAQLADVAVRVPESETYQVQELHLPIYHCWCLMLEDRFF